MEPITALVDLDDFLIHTCALYDLCIETFGQYMERHHGLTGVDCIRKFRSVDHESMQTYGFGRDRFGTSFLRTFTLLTGRRADALEHSFLRGLGYSVFGMVAQPVEGALTLLETLEEMGLRVVIYTMGDRHIQVMRAGEAGFLSVVHEVKVVDQKSARQLRFDIAAFNLDPRAVICMGDSIRSDINPALANCVKCIYVPAATHFAYGAVAPIGNNYTVCASLADVPKAIEQMLGAAVL